MNEYIYAWITVALLAVLAELLLPGGKSGKMAGHMRFLAGLCILAALVPTVKEGIARLNDLADGDHAMTFPSVEAGRDYDAYFSDHLSDMTKEECEAWVYEALQKHFSLPRDKCFAVVTVETDDKGIPLVASVEICLYGTAMLANPHSIESYISTQLSAPCIVSVDLDGM